MIRWRCGARYRVPRRQSCRRLVRPYVLLGEDDTALSLEVGYQIASPTRMVTPDYAVIWTRPGRAIDVCQIRGTTWCFGRDETRGLRCYRDESRRGSRPSTPHLKMPQPVGNRTGQYPPRCSRPRRMIDVDRWHQPGRRPRTVRAWRARAKPFGLRWKLSVATNSAPSSPFSA
jgi:hypothetical protein